jgi:hypothetical protein
MVQQALPVCVIGAGLIGMRHVQAALESPMVTLTAIVESNPDHRAALALKGLPMVAGFEDISNWHQSSYHCYTHTQSSPNGN